MYPVLAKHILAVTDTVPSGPPAPHDAPASASSSPTPFLPVFPKCTLDGMLSCRAAPLFSVCGVPLAPWAFFALSFATGSPGGLPGASGAPPGGAVSDDTARQQRRDMRLSLTAALHSAAQVLSVLAGDSNWAAEPEGLVGAKMPPIQAGGMRW